MKDAIVTVRLASATRRRLEALAKREGRSLSAQIERLIEAGLGSGARTPARLGARSLAGVYSGARVPTLADFKQIRSDLSRSLTRAR
jgi:hypothetical protein